MMRLLFLSHYAKLFGANLSLLALVDELVKLGVNITVVVAGEGEMVQALRARGVVVHVVSMAWWTSTAPWPKWSTTPKRKWLWRCIRKISLTAFKQVVNFRACLAVARIVRKQGIDIIYTNSVTIPVGAWVAFCLKKPHVWHLREVMDEHFESHYDFGKAFTLKWIGKSARLIAVSHYVCEYYKKGLSSLAAKVIYNGVVPQAHFSNPPQRNRRTSAGCRPYIFGVVGIMPGKNQQGAIRAFAQIAPNYLEVSLKIIGDGDPSSLRELAENLGVGPRVSFEGFFSDAERIYTSFDALVVSSLREAMGRVTAEAMAFGLPVIGHASGGTQEMICSEKTGLLYSGGPEALARAMVRFIEDPEQAQRWGEAGWHLAREKYTTEQYGAAVYEVLCSLG